MARLGKAIKGLRKTDTHEAGRGAKVELRRRLLSEVGQERAVVFDAFAGSGEMYREVWSAAAGYVGCDLRMFRDGRRAFVADNRRVLRAVDLATFNVFDLDAYGSPWEQALIIAARRKVAADERIAIALTEGSGLKLKTGGIPDALRILCGVKGKPAGLARHQDELIGAAIAGFARRLNCGVERRWEAARGGGAAMHYIGLVLVGLGEDRLAGG